MQRIRGEKVDVLAWADPAQIESVALDQLRNIARLPWVFHHVAAMPDVHYGKGATVGSVIAMKDALSPAAVGVDIGCGLAAVRTSLTASGLPDSLAGLRSEIERAIPVGFEQHRKPVQSDPELWREFQELTPAVRNLEPKARHQLGTLGGGNHFLELCLDTEDRVWLMLHSGSRNIGKTLAEIHIGRARKLAHNQRLPDRDLAVFLAGTPEMRDYRRDLFWRSDMLAPTARRCCISMKVCSGASDRRSVSRTRCTATTTTWPRRCTSARRCWSRVRARSAPGKATWASSPGRWAPARTSCAAWGTRTASRAPPTAPAGG